MPEARGETRGIPLLIDGIRRRAPAPHSKPPFVATRRVSSQPLQIAPGTLRDAQAGTGPGGGNQQRQRPRPSAGLASCLQRNSGEFYVTG